MDAVNIVISQRRPKISVCIFKGSTAWGWDCLKEVGLESEVLPPLCIWGRGLWSSSSIKPLNMCLFVKCESGQSSCTCWTSVSTAVHSVVLSGVLRYSEVLLSVFWFSCSTFSHVACWCFCQYSVWPPGGAATVCMPSRGFQVKGPFAAVEGRFLPLLTC